MLDDGEGTEVLTRIAMLYGLIGVLCLAMPYASVAMGGTDSSWWPPALPLAFTSAALGASAGSRGGGGGPEWVAAILWGAGSLAVATPLSAPSQDLGWLIPAIRVQALLAGAGAVGVFTSVVLAARRRRPVLLRGIEIVALLAIGVLLARGSVRSLLPQSTQSDGLAAIAAEIRLFQTVLACAATSLLVVGVAGKAGAPSSKWARRPTSA